MVLGLFQADGGVTLDLPWVLATVSAVVAALSTAIVAVYHGRIADLKERIKRQDEQIDRLLADVEPRIGRLEESRVRGR